MNKTFRHVLLVDDCDLILRRVAESLRDEGYLVTTANSGAEALIAIQNYCPDYVITDWEMPNINGQMLCQCLRNDTFDHYIYLIIMTAHSEHLGLVEGLGAGADDYITKPVNIRELLARMASGARVLELDRRLNYAAHHDPLTGILNRRSLFSTLTTTIELCSRNRQPVSCIMLDVDHFKQINDYFGHLVGDQVLVKIAECLSARFRNADFVCRYGGEEFAVILPECTEADAFACAERCRMDFENLIFEAGNSGLKVTASFGCAQLQTGDTPISMIDHADHALMAAKRRGRNQVVNFSESSKRTEVFAPSEDLLTIIELPIR